MEQNPKQPETSHLAVRRFEKCIKSFDTSWVPEKCMVLRRGYKMCRHGLLNPNYRFFGTNYE